MGQTKSTNSKYFTPVCIMLLRHGLAISLCKKDMKFAPVGHSNLLF